MIQWCRIRAVAVPQNTLAADLTGAELPIQREELMSQRSITSTTSSPRRFDAPGAPRPIFSASLARAALILTAVTAAVLPSGVSAWAAQPAAATPSSACTATLFQASQVDPNNIYTPSINVTGTGYLPGESVQVYFDAALPFGGSAQGSRPVPATADSSGNIAATLDLGALPAPNTRYAIAATGNRGSCASFDGVVVPTTASVPIEPLGSPGTTPPGVTTPDHFVVSPISQTVLISSSRVMSNTSDATAAIDLATHDNYGGVPSNVPLANHQTSPMYVPIAVRRDLSGPTWATFAITVPGTLSFNVHSIIISGTNPTAVSGTNNGAPYTLPAGQLQHDAGSVRYIQVAPGLSTNTPSGPAGSTLTVTGAGMAAGSPIILTFTSGGTVFTPTNAAPVSSNSNGAFTASFAVPSVPDGPAVIVATDVARTLASASFTVGSATSAVTLNLTPGWNLIAVPVVTGPPLTGLGLLSQARAASGGHIAELAVWNGSYWGVLVNQDGITSGSTIPDFNLALGVGYFVYLDSAATLTIPGATPTSVPTQALQIGWNLVALPLTPDGQPATALLTSLSTLQPLEAASWTGADWLVQQPSDSVSRFTLNRTSGYFVYLQQSGSWSGQTMMSGVRSLQGLHVLRRAVGLPTLPLSPGRPATRTHHLRLGHPLKAV